MEYFRFGYGGYGDQPRGRHFGGGERHDFHGGHFGGGRGRRGDRRNRRNSQGKGNFKKGGGNGGGRRSGKWGFGGKRKAEDDPMKAKKHKGGNNWKGPDRHPLMLPKNFESKPDNFEDEWVFVVIPPGRRRVVVAANNITQSYNNSEVPDIKFYSCLPNGNSIKEEMFKQEHLTLLDAIYSPEKKKFYIVDMMHWRHYPYYDTEAEFRFFCLESKWAELVNPIETRTYNEYPLELLPKHQCSETAIIEALMACQHKVESLLFIKKKSVYVVKESSNSLRLKLDKMEEVLGIPVPEGVVYINSNIKGSQKEETTAKKEQTQDQTEDGEADTADSGDIKESNDNNVGDPGVNVNENGEENVKEYAVESTYDHDVEESQVNTVDDSHDNTIDESESNDNVE